MRLSKTLIYTLRRLCSGESVPSSSLRRDIAATLEAEGMLTVRARGSHRSYAAVNPAALRSFLTAHHEELRDIDTASATSATRAEQAAISGNSKLMPVRSCPGFPVNSYVPVECTLHGKPFVVAPQQGSFVFVSDWQSFAIPPETVVVGMENMENFRMIRSQRDLFDAHTQGTPVLFVSRYPQSTDLRSWLQSIPNHYLHFGDFDLAGINIFLTEFHAFLGERASLLIPADIERRLAAGSAARYNAQYLRFGRLASTIPQVQGLIDLINRYHRCYDQEGYITL